MLNIYITIDSECSMGGAWEHPHRSPVVPEKAILGQIGSAQYGIPMIGKILCRYGLRGVFFAEMFVTHTFGEPRVSAAYESVLRDGHDVQLHLHPNHLYYARLRSGSIPRSDVRNSCDLLASHTASKQRELLQEGREIFRRLFGRDPIGYRAGNYSANSDTLEALAQVGLRVDTSYSAAYLGKSCQLRFPEMINSPRLHRSGVWEVPVTNFKTRFSSGYRPLEVNAISSAEMRTALLKANALQLGTATIVMHSFSFLKKDRFYDQIAPNPIVVRRFENLCRFVAKHADKFNVLTYSADPLPDKEVRSEFPTVGIWNALTRQAVQAFNRVTQ